MRKVCEHLLKENAKNHYFFYHFTGNGTAYHLCCEVCMKQPDELAQHLRDVSDEVFNQIDDNLPEGFIGQPQILERATDLKFAHTDIRLKKPLPDELIDIRPTTQPAIWMALLKSGALVQINFAEKQFTPLYTLPPATLEIGQHTRLVISSNQHFVAIVNDRASTGIVVNIPKKKITMQLHRGSYHVEHTRFPVAFFNNYLIHATDWNRLDITNLDTGKLLTSRHTRWEKDGSRPEHYLDYFHTDLTISPDGEWIAEDGWVWTPIGVPRVWNLQSWLRHNIWESEDGKSVRYLTQKEDWDHSLYWIDTHTLAVWGLGMENMIAAVQLFDVRSGQRKTWFAGPEQGLLVFDKYLFSVSPKGTDIRDVATGEKLSHDATFIPRHYHHANHQFLSLLPDGVFRLSTLLQGD